MVGFKRVALLVVMAVLFLPQAGHSLTGGAGVDVVDGDASLDSTEVTGTQTWSDGSTDATVTWTWDLSSGTDPSMKFSDGSVSIEDGEITGGDEASDTLTVLGTSGTPSGAGGDVIVGDETNGVQWNEDTKTFEVISSGTGSIVATSVSGSADDGSRFIQFQQNTHTNEPAFPTDDDSVRLYCEKDFYGVSSGDDACFLRHTGDSPSEDRIATNDENGLLLEQITAPGDPPGPDQGSNDYTALYSTSSDDLWIHPEGGSAQQVCTSSTLGSCTNPTSAATLSGSDSDGNNLIDIYQNDTEPGDPATDVSRYYCHKDDIATGVDSCFIRHDGDNTGRILVEDSDDGILLTDITAPGAAPASGYNTLYSNSGTLYMHPYGGSATQICTEADIGGCSASGGGGATLEGSTSNASLTSTTLVDIGNLTESLDASSTYYFNGMLILSGLDGADDLTVRADYSSTISASNWHIAGSRTDNTAGTLQCAAGPAAVDTSINCEVGSGSGKDFVATFTGYITTTGAGTLKMQAALQALGSSTVEAGSTWVIQKAP